MAVDYFLKVGGVDGDSMDDKHQKWIEVMSFSFGASQEASGSASGGGARSAGRADLSDLSVMKVIDKASPKLMLSCCKGDHLKEVTLEICRNTGDKQKITEIKLSDVLITSVQCGGSAGGDGGTEPTEQLSFNYGKIEFTFTHTDQKTGKAAGDVKMNWSPVENKGA
jgi:type VI secretion system secreted protein Hcp